MVKINAILIPQVECPMCRLPITYDLAELKTVASSAENDEEVCSKLLAIYNHDYIEFPRFIKIKFLLTVSIYCEKPGDENKEYHQFEIKPSCTTKLSIEMLHLNRASVPHREFVIGKLICTFFP